MSQTSATFQEITNPTNPDSRNLILDLENFTMPKSPKSVFSKTEITPRSPTKSPTLVSLKGLSNNSPVTKLSQKGSMPFNTNEEELEQTRIIKAIPSMPTQMQRSPSKKIVKPLKKEALKEYARAREQDYDYMSQLLVYIPENISSISTTNKQSIFSTFNQLSRSTRNSHQKKLEDILDATSETLVFSTDKYYANKIARIDAVNSVLQLNKLQKNSYVNQIETEKRSVVLPLINKLKEKKVKEKKMPHIKVLPSRKMHGANVIERLGDHGNQPQVLKTNSNSDSKGTLVSASLDSKKNNSNSKNLDEKTDDFVSFPVFNYKVYWYIPVNEKTTTWRPGAREGHTLTTIGKTVVLYGGINTSLLNDISIYDPTMSFWSQPKVTGEIPMFGRHGHSAVEYKKSLIIFGGEHEFNPTLNFRECLNDVRMFTPENNEWKYLKSQSNLIDPRRYHTAVIHGRNMYVYGGISNEGEYMKDVWTFDLRLLTWNEVEVEGDKEAGLAFHTMCSVFIEKTTSSNIYKEKPKIAEEGLYVFGGKDGEGRILNTLKYLPVWAKNYQWKYPVVKGIPPEARYSHSMLFYEPMGILFIYGGRNDTLYGSHHDICLNDIRILNLEQMAWSPVTILGNLPGLGRNKHAMASFGSKILVFGGIGFQQLADDELITMDLNQSEVRRLVKMHGDMNAKHRNRGSFRSSLGQDDLADHVKFLDDENSVSKPIVSYLPLPLTQSHVEDSRGLTHHRSKKALTHRYKQSSFI